ncbi:glutathione-dependent formaldehyde-activating enzyme [Purpureocillium lavendulum]|uniref:Glutathione-dependent formaldehyde-activating enzyme n=1 Tax=Purpureocillium lavendulum TaxID=1247861 RepID=A0AB34FR60_9HYPO|nr:glutathione-dependent formaldehyde-activating enzyme [Purpureocillium lavendulum]
MAATTSDAAANPPPPLRTYRGNCHCGAYVYEARLPEIRSVFECNCSICRKKGYLWVFPGEGDFSVVKGGDDALTGYTFGPGKLTHKFCPTCATPLMAHFPDGPPGKRRALNVSPRCISERRTGGNGWTLTAGGRQVRAMQGVTTSELERKPFNGAALGDPYVPPPYKGPTPEAVEGQRLYTGTCHCGRVGVALASKPLDATFDELMVECNCSVCERNGYRWIYPETERVVLHAAAAAADDDHGDNQDDKQDDADAIGRYSFARGIISKTFCRTCGVPLTNERRALSPADEAALPERTARFYAYAKTHHPVNLRAFWPAVDLAALPAPTRNDGANKIEPPYVNP